MSFSREAMNVFFLATSTNRTKYINYFKKIPGEVSAPNLSSPSPREVDLKKITTNARNSKSREFGQLKKTPGSLAMHAHTTWTGNVSV